MDLGAFPFQSKARLASSVNWTLPHKLRFACWQTMFFFRSYTVLFTCIFHIVLIYIYIHIIIYIHYIGIQLPILECNRYHDSTSQESWFDFDYVWVLPHDVYNNFWFITRAILAELLLHVVTMWAWGLQGKWRFILWPSVMRLEGLLGGTWGFLEHPAVRGPGVSKFFCGDWQAVHTQDSRISKKIVVVMGRGFQNGRFGKGTVGCELLVLGQCWGVRPFSALTGQGRLRTVYMVRKMEQRFWLVSGLLFKEVFVSMLGNVIVHPVAMAFIFWERSEPTIHVLTLNSFHGFSCLSPKTYPVVEESVQLNKSHGFTFYSVGVTVASIGAAMSARLWFLVARPRAASRAAGQQGL